jgi:type IV pilus assembly protein PilX
MNLLSGIAPARAQRGISLLIVLILLLVTTLLGVVVLRGTLLEERMSANMYDRSLAFQAAESALRQAEEQVRQAVLAGNPIGFDCSSLGTSCPVIPANAYTGNVAGCVARARDCWIDATSAQVLAAGRPQYYIQFMGQRDSMDELGLGSSANANQYGGGGGVPLESVYRVLARSHDPGNGSARAVVVLQSNIAVK